MKKSHISQVFANIAVERVQLAESQEYRLLCQEVVEILRQHGHDSLSDQWQSMELEHGCQLITSGYQQGFCDGVAMVKESDSAYEVGA